MRVTFSALHIPTVSKTVSFEANDNQSFVRNGAVHHYFNAL